MVDEPDANIDSSCFFLCFFVINFTVRTHLQVAFLYISKTVSVNM